jgi:cleavage and polyadenylation specificity factor subunit 1
MHALRQDILPSSGVEFAASLRLTPSTLERPPLPPNSTARHELAARVLCNVVVARSNILRIFEVREELASRATHVNDERHRQSAIRRDTEPVEGEAEMDHNGESVVNMGAVKVNTYITSVSHPSMQCKNVSTWHTPGTFSLTVFCISS